MKKIKIIEAEGTHYEIGHKIGSETKKEILALIEKIKRVTSKNPQLEENYAKYLVHVQKYPFIIDELKGMADGAGVDFDIIAKMNLPELDKDLEDDNCSTFVVKNKGIIGHNEDGRHYDDMFLLKAVFPTGGKVMSLCYYGWLPGSAVNANAHGLIMVCNALTANDVQIGEPKRIIARRLIECKDSAQAIELITNTKRAQGQNFIFADRTGIVDVETSATDMHVTEINDNFFHCNNYLSDEMKKYEAKKQSAGSFMRSGEASKVCASLSSIEDMKEALSSHTNRPSCLCSHGAEENDENKTLGSIYVDLTAKKVWVGYGFTCRTELMEIKLP